jgi:hypothetical protein
MLTVIAAVVVLAAGCGGPTTASTAPAEVTETPAPVALAPFSDAVRGQTIDGITCDSSEQLVYHIHAHLAIFVNSVQRGIPKNIGVLFGGRAIVPGGACLYWLHSHTDDGIIHVESPKVQTFTLGDYFDIWGIPLDSTRVGPAGGSLIVYVDGHQYSGNVRTIALDVHSLIQLDVDGNVAPAPFSFPLGD